MLQHAGGDATDLWTEVGHTARARGLMERYCVGKVQSNKRYTGFSTPAYDKDEEGWKVLIKNKEDQEDFIEDVSSYRDSTR